MGVITPDNEKMDVSHHDSVSEEYGRKEMELEAQNQSHIDSGNYQREAPPVDEALRKRRKQITYVHPVALPLHRL